jgi:thioredoxin reductase (NADPH)
MEETEVKKADIAIIGTGPAGISAAVTAAARGKSLLLFGSSELSPKLTKAHQINNLPGFYGKSGSEIASAFKDHLDSLHIEITDKRITGIYDMGENFTLLSGQESFEVQSVIIATGVDFGKPLPGEKEYLGRGVSYCATCDAMLYKGKEVAVIAYSKSEEKEADFLSDVCSKVYYIPLYKDPVTVSSKIEIVRDKPVEITGGGMKAEHLVLGSQAIDPSCTFILRESVAPSTLLEGIKMDGSHIAVDRSLKTSVSGVFAAGDVTGIPYQYAKALGEGNVAALSAAAYIDKKKK